MKIKKSLDPIISALYNETYLCKKESVNMTKKIYVVGAAILNEQHQILASKRSDDRILGALWEFPGARLSRVRIPKQP